MSSGKVMRYSQAKNIADRFLKAISPHVLKAEIVGSIRRECHNVGDIEIVCIENMDNPMSNLFVEGYPGLVINGPRLKRFKYSNGDLQIELYITSPKDYGRIMAIRTGSSAFSHLKLATTWNRMGWAGTEDGLRRKKECDKKGSKWKVKPEYEENPTLPPDFITEEDFFKFLKIPWIDPKLRNWVSTNDKLNYAT